MKTTEEKYMIIKNRMIAEFMGFKLQDNPNERWFGQFFTTPTKAWSGRIEILHFDTSWEWLMSVWKHINSMSGSRFTFTIRPDFCYILDTNTDKEIVYNEHGATELELVYETVIQFIKWYNENK